MVDFVVTMGFTTKTMVDFVVTMGFTTKTIVKPWLLQKTHG